MGDSELPAMIRAISGDVAVMVKQRTDMDLRMIKDPRTLILIKELKDHAKRKKKHHLIRYLDRAEKVERIYQYTGWTGGLSTLTTSTTPG